MTEPLRKVMTRAANVWDVPVGRVHWRLHMLAEPQERVREASQGEEGAILSQVGDGYREAVRFTFMNGCRLEEVVGLEWPRVDFFGRQFTVIGKGRKSRVIPMNTETFELLWAERNRHPAKVFTFVAKRNDPAEHHVKGERYPMTYAGLQNTFRRAARRAGVQNFHFHDIRHTAATRTGRKSSLTVVQKLLGHSNIATTARYTHAMVEDVRDALEAASPTKSPTKGGRRAAK
jgi:integrase